MNDAVALKRINGGSNAGGAIPTIWQRDDISRPAATIEEERLYRKQRLASAFRVFAQLGFAFGASGHITVRDPEHEDCFWINPVMQHFATMRVSDLLLVDHDGKIVEGEGIVNVAGFAIHSQLHAAKPDVIAAAHAHSVYGKAWSSFGRVPQTLTQDAGILHDDVAVFDTFSGMVEDLSEGEQIARALGSKNTVILKNHGILTTGKCVESAAFRYIALESACQIQMLAVAAGGGDPIPDDIGRHTHSQIGTEIACIGSYEPYWQKIIQHEPDVLD